MHAFDRVTLDPRRQGLAARTNDRGHDRRVARCPVLGIEHEPHGVRELGRESMKEQRREQTDRSARNRSGHLGETVGGREFSVGKLV